MRQPIVTIEDMSGGVNRFVQPFLLETNEQIETVNMVSTELGALALRKAISPSIYHSANDSTLSSSDILHSAEVLSKYNGNKYLALVSGSGKLYRAQVGGAISDSGITLNETFTDSCVFLDQMFLVSLHDATMSFDGSTFSTTANVTDAPKGKFVEQYKAKVYVAFVNDGDYHPNRIIYSNLPVSGSLTWDNSNNYVDVERDDGDKIMGLKKFGERLLIFKEYSMYRYDEESVYKVVGAPGTVSNRSIQIVDQKLVYLAHDGIRVYDGGLSYLKSRAIQPYIDGITDHGKYYSFAWVKGGTYNIYVGDITNEDYDIDIEDAVISYDIYSHEFRLHSYKNDGATHPFFDAVAISGITSTTTTSTSSTSTTLAYVTYDTKDHYIAGVGGLYKMYGGYSEKDVNNAEVTYTGTILYQYIYPSGPETTNEFSRVVLHLSRAGRIKLSYRIDGGRWKNTLVQTQGQRNILDIPFNNAKGCGIQFQIRAASGSEPCIIRRLAVFIKQEEQL